MWGGYKDTIFMNAYYDTLQEAIVDLQREGYTEDYNLCNEGLSNMAKGTICPVGELWVVKHYRFEGKTDPSDSAILYVIETEGGEKGLLVDAYGAYSGNISEELLRKLKLGI